MNTMKMIEKSIALYILQAAVPSLSRAEAQAQINHPLYMIMGEPSMILTSDLGEMIAMLVRLSPNG